ncbi:heat shock factor binding protein 1-domain-containing protein [Hypoxylon argillaceum]|nr:heat shock factor binding protein 1-domain-containing protein [Hypoxylon argillaceum]KAI1155731.1 heat shock factor binding protein 1-domain-containing protein [Nemania diffusa]
MSSVKKDESTKKEGGNSSDELTTVVEELLNSLSNKFTTVSGEIFAKMDEMSRRLDSLEAALRANEEKAPGSPSKT